MSYICARQIESILIIRKLGILLVSITLISFTLKNEEKEKLGTKTTAKKHEVTADILKLEKNFVGFKEALGFKESQGRYYIVNSHGYLGKYQFGKGTLRRFKIYNSQKFLKNPELQERAFTALCQVNKWILRRDISRFVGKKINGIRITESGIIASAHLAGPGNVKKFLRSYGNYQFKDAFGTSIESYMKKFAGYDLSYIKADKKATV
ncbi:peptidoglycan-binding protein LysM [uncultured Tenacibaculum sp.]|uniref:peptidoglycan-binding protein LysM n=1 Tax=uncultured Tenacibaculum sp. TaxID=174713 RepID=UPI002636ACCF|nr:peptidoglycan-binding protein LysM [uncultured Tenacibaculum sp.]